MPQIPESYIYQYSILYLQSNLMITNIVFQQTQPTIDSNITLIFSDNWEFSLLVTRKKQTFFSFFTLSTCSVLWSSVTAGLIQRHHNTLLVCTLQVKMWLNFDLTNNQLQNCWDIVLKLGSVREENQSSQPSTLPFVRSRSRCFVVFYR